MASPVLHELNEIVGASQCFSQRHDISMVHAMVHDGLELENHCLTLSYTMIAVPSPTNRSYSVDDVASRCSIYLNHAVLSSARRAHQEAFPLISEMRRRHYHRS